MTEKKSKPRTGPKTWKPGQSGNPGGRSPRVGPNGETAAQLARLHTREAIDTLAAGMKAPEWQVRVACANSLLQRGWGTPKPDEDGKDKPDIAEVLEKLIDKLPS